MARAWRPVLVRAGTRGWNDRSTHAFDRREVLAKRIEEIFHPSAEPAGPVVLHAMLRSEMGKHVRRLRDAQRVPCLVQGQGLPDVMCSVELRHIVSLRNRGGFVRVFSVVPGPFFWLR